MYLWVREKLAEIEKYTSAINAYGVDSQWLSFDRAEVLLGACTCLKMQACFSETVYLLGVHDNNMLMFSG